MIFFLFFSVSTHTTRFWGVKPFVGGRRRAQIEHLGSARLFLEPFGASSIMNFVILVNVQPQQMVHKNFVARKHQRRKISRVCPSPFGPVSISYLWIFFFLCLTTLTGKSLSSPPTTPGRVKTFAMVKPFSPKSPESFNMKTFFFLIALTIHQSPFRKWKLIKFQFVSSGFFGRRTTTKSFRQWSEQTEVLRGWMNLRKNIKCKYWESVKSFWELSYIWSVKLLSED